MTGKSLCQAFGLLHGDGLLIALLVFDQEHKYNFAALKPKTHGSYGFAVEVDVGVARGSIGSHLLPN